MKIELPFDLQISPIFNVSDIYPFKDSSVQIEETISGEDVPFVYWKGQSPQKEQPQIKVILDKRISKNTINKDYFQYLVKWKGQPYEDATWMIKLEISKYNVNLEEQLKNYFIPSEYVAGASS